MGVIFVDNMPKIAEEIEGEIELALEEIARELEMHARDNAPYDTGRLRNSITHKTNPKETTVFTDVEYAPYQEFGTSRGVPATHFLQRAGEEHVQDYTNIMLKHIKK